MGCWNGTCAITNVPVTHGEEVVVMLLVQQPREIESLCYPTAFWRPYPFYFFGKYNDYGAVEECHGELLPYILEDIKHRLVSMELGENEYHDIAVDPAAFDIDLLFEADHEQRLFIRSESVWKCRADDEFAGCENKLRLEHIIIRKDVWNGLMTEYYTESYRDENKRYLPALIEIGHAEVQKLIDERDEQAASGDSDKDKAVEKLLRMWERRSNYDNPFHWVKESAKFCDTYEPIELVEKLIEHDRIPDALAAVEQMCAMYWLDSYMNNGRRMWSPQSGAGSQNDSTQAQRLTAELTLKAAEVLRTRWGDEEEE